MNRRGSMRLKYFCRSIRKEGEMNKAEAIKILTHYDTDLDAWNDEDNEAAVKLGIEALKAWKEHRGTGSLMDPLLLPGETKE